MVKKTPPKEPKEVTRDSAPVSLSADAESLDWVFDYHRPNDEQRKMYDDVRVAAKNMARVIFESCPACADRSAAIRKVREAMFTANAAIALHGTV